MTDEFCRVCDKPKANEREGSITAWLFVRPENMICQCADATSNEGQQSSPGSTLSQGGTLALKLRTDLALLKQQRPVEIAISLPELNEQLAQSITFLRKLGEGGMGTVYLVREKVTGEELAIKLINRSLLSDTKSIQRFNQEATAVRQLSHPNLVSLRDYAAPLVGTPYILMEYVAGVDLSAVLVRHGPLAIEEALDVFIQVADALVYAHSKDIIHRDLKPANIIVSLGDDRVVKVVDFGIAKMIKPYNLSGDLTEADEIIGTPYYMSPEQCQGDALDVRSDLYSLGCVMYETVSGRPPFTQRNPVKAILQHLNEKPAKFGAAVSKQKHAAAFEAVIFKCLEKSPKDRYQSAKALLGDLQKIRAGLRPHAMIRFDKTGKTALLVFCCLAAGAAAALHLLGAKTVHPGSADKSIAPVARESGQRRLTAAPPRALLVQRTAVKLDVPESLHLNDQEMAPVSEMHSLAKANLSHQNVTAACLKYFVGKPITYLELASTNVGDEGFDTLAQLKGLEYLGLNRTQITGQALKVVSTLPHLETLRVSQTNVAGADLVFLEPLKSLRSLELNGCKITDLDAGELAKLPLQALDLDDCQLTDEGARLLSTSKTLRFLSLNRNNRIGEQGLKDLCRLRPIVLSLVDSRVSTQTNLSDLADVSSLRVLLLGDSARSARIYLDAQMDCNIVLTKEQFSEIGRYRKQTFREPLTEREWQVRKETHKYFIEASKAMHRGDFAKAVEYLTLDMNSKKSDRGMAWSLQNRGYCYLEMKKYKEGIADLTKAIAIRPEFSINYRNRARAYDLIGRHDLAAADTRTANELDPDGRAAHRR